METRERNIIKKFSRQTYLEKVFPFIREKKTQNFLMVSMTLAAIIIFGFFAITPTLVTITGLQRQLEDAKFANQQLQIKIDNLGTLNDKYAQLGNDLTLISDALPTTPQVPTLLAQINALANENNVQLQTLTVNPFIIPLSQETTSPTPIVFSLTVTGRSDAIMAFLSSLGNFNRIVTIDSLQIHLDPKNTNFTLTGKAYTNM